VVRAVLFLLVLGIAVAMLLRELAAEGKRRVRRHELEAQVKAREKAATTEHGGSPEHPILVPSPSVVEAEAARHRCPRCESEMRLVEHAAETRGETRLRVARLTCPACAAVRELFFQIGLPS
jgi:hypothetical protein